MVNLNLDCVRKSTVGISQASSFIYIHANACLSPPPNHPPIHPSNHPFNHNPCHWCFKGHLSL